MTARELAQSLELVRLGTGGDDERPVVTGYVCDLLSYVMGRAPQGCAWITIMANLNVAAVAVLSDVTCVILVEGVKPDAMLMKKAEDENVLLYGTSLDAYTLAWRIRELIG